MVKEEGLGVKGGGLGWENVGKSGRVGEKAGKVKGGRKVGRVKGGQRVSIRGGKKR